MGVVHLALVCSLMFIGPLITGVIPLAFNVANGWMQWMEMLGAGVMIGSVFAVVLPEGFDALYAVSAKKVSDHHHHSHPEEDLLRLEDHDDGDDHHSSIPHWLPGMALLAGFLAMLLFEFEHHRAEHGKAGKDSFSKVIKRRHDYSQHETHYDAQDHTQARNCGHKHTHGSSPSTSEQSSVLTALLVHAAADGLAVGVASMSTSTRLAISVGCAMVLHKGPVALGLGAYLDLVMFALASPVAAILSYGLLRQVHGSSSSTFVAMCVLFSAGTFVYAACVHMLPDLSCKAQAWSSMAVLCLGALIPCSINLLDLHHH